MTEGPKGDECTCSVHEYNVYCPKCRGKYGATGPRHVKKLTCPDDCYASEADCRACPRRAV